MSQDALLLEVSSEILMLLDAQSLRIVQASPGAHAQLGYAWPELHGMEIGDLECALSDLFFWEEMASASGPMEAQGSYRKRDGTVFDIRKYAQRAGDAQQFYALRARPVRSDRSAEPEASAVGLHLAATLEATDDGILLTDNEGAILNMNRRLSDMMGFPRELLSERDDHGIAAFIESVLLQDPGSPTSPTALSQVIDLRTDLGADTFETLYFADGRVLECVSHPARDRERTIGRVFCYRDVTQRVQYEHSLKEARDTAEQATLSKGQFLANMSHEIRTPMNAILGMLSLMHATELSNQQLDYVSKTESAAQSLLGLLNDILDFSKIEAGKLALDPQPFSIDRVLRELSVILSANLGNKPVELLYDIDPAIPHTLLGDAMRLQQVLINLGGNALKFTPQGEVVLRVRLLEQSAGQARLAIAVQDSGIGIAPEHQAKIFSDFSQAESSTTRRFGGTGLGLSICKRLVALMGGELGLNSVPGQGSDFHFEISLPVVAQEAPARPDVSGLSALLVDDNEVSRGLLTSAAQSLGWQVDNAASGADSIAMLQDRAARGLPPYQALFLDWEMPHMDGWEALARMRQLGDAFGTPVTVMVTAHKRDYLGLRSEQEQASLNAFLVKPITASMLRDAVMDARAGHNRLRARARNRPAGLRRLQGMRLLVVEDNLVNQQVARELLQAEGALVELAENGQLGVAAVAAARPPFDAVLMDIQMPVMDGFGATRAIRQQLGLSKLPIVAMTANAMSSDRDECLLAGMNDHVGKPFDLAYLVKVLLQVSGFQVLPNTVTLAQLPLPLAAPVAFAAATAAVPAGTAAPAPPAKPAAALEIDLVNALDRLDGMSDLYIALAGEFVTELHAVDGLYRQSLQAGLPDQAARQMHTLKGTAATLGAMELSALAAQLETLCKAAQTEAALDRADALQSMVQASIAALDRASAQLQQAGG